MEWTNKKPRKPKFPRFLSSDFNLDIFVWPSYNF